MVPTAVGPVAGNNEVPRGVPARGNEFLTYRKGKFSDSGLG